MSEDKQQPQDVLRAEILADAKRQAGRVLQRARNEAEGITQTAATELETWRAAQLDLAQAEARRASDLVMAGVPVQIGKLRANRIESLLQSVRDEARQRLDSREGLDVRQVLINLTAEAIRGMAGTKFSLVVCDADCPLLGDSELDAIRALVGRPGLELDVTGDPQSAEVGLIVRGRDGEEVWDNRVSKRMERLWPAMRREIARRAAWDEVPKLETGETV